MGPSEGKILAIDTVSQNTLKTISNHEILRELKKTVLESYGSHH